MHHALRQHPRLFLPRKELNFFAFANGGGRDRPVKRGSILSEEKYLSLFHGVAPDLVLGESSPEYMINPAACPRIAAVLPGVRLVAILRNPIERAYSHYMMHRRDGDEPCFRFSDALDQQDARRSRRDTRGYYVACGFYAAQLRPYFDHFPPEQIHVLLHDDLRAQYLPTLARVFEFLGVDPSFAPTDQGPVNVSGVPTSRMTALALVARRRLRGVAGPIVPEAIKLRLNRAIERRLYQPVLEPADRARLVEVYRSDVDDLGRLLNRDLSHWLHM